LDSPTERIGSRKEIGGAAPVGWWDRWWDLRESRGLDDFGCDDLLSSSGDRFGFDNGFDKRLRVNSRRRCRRGFNDRGMLDYNDGLGPFGRI